MEASDQLTIKTLLKFCRICGTFPPEKPSRWFYTYQILICILNLLYSAFCMYHITIVACLEKNSLDVILSILTSFFATMQSLSFQIVCLWFPDAWKNLYENLNIDYIENESRNLWVFLEILIFNLLFLIKLALGLWIWYPLSGISQLMNHNFRHINDYFCMVSVLVLVHVNVIIRKKILLMNEILMRSQCTRSIQATYFKIIHLINRFSVTFGYQILCVLVHTMAVLLQSLRNVLWFNDVNNNGNNGLKILVWQTVYSSSLIVIM